MEVIYGILIGLIIVLLIVVGKIVREAYLDSKDIKERNFYQYHKRKRNNKNK